MGIEFVKNSSSSQFYHRPSGSSDHSWKMVLRSHFHCWTFEHYSAVSFSWIWSPTDQRGPTDQWQSNLLVNIHKHTDHFRNIFTSRHFWFLKLVETALVLITAIILKREKFHVVEKDIFIARTNIFFPVGQNLFCEARKEGGRGGWMRKNCICKTEPSLTWAPINPTIRLPQQ